MIPIALSRTVLRCAHSTDRNPGLHRLLPFAACLLSCLFVSCTEQTPPMVDTTPVGEGLQVIGYAVIGAAVLGILGKLVK